MAQPKICRRSSTTTVSSAVVTLTHSLRPSCWPSVVSIPVMCVIERQRRGVAIWQRCYRVRVKKTKICILKKWWRPLGRYILEILKAFFSLDPIDLTKITCNFLLGCLIRVRHKKCKFNPTQTVDFWSGWITDWGKLNPTQLVNTPNNKEQYAYETRGITRILA